MISENKDPFYTKDAGFDYIRFPLIKPYEVWSLDKGKSWYIESGIKPKTVSEINRANGIREINIIQGIIVVYCKDKPIVGGQKYPEAWYVINPETHVNKGFINERDFKDYVQETGIGTIEWKTPEELFKQFSNTYCLPWIPDCKE